MKFRSLLAALLFPASMTLAAITGADRGTGANSNSEASTTITPGSNFTTGATGILCWHGDNAVNSASNTPTSITDSAGNIWYRRGVAPTSGAGANTGVETAVYTAILNNGLTTGGSMVMTYTTANVVAKAWTLTEANPGTAGNIVLFKGYGGTTQGNSTGQQGTSAIINIGDMIFATNGAESADTYTGDSDTTNGTWSTKQSIGTGTGASGMSTMSQYKIQTTVPSIQTYDPVITIADNATAMMALTEVPPFTRFASGSNNSESTSTITFSEPIAQNSQTVLCISADNNNATGPGAVGNFPATLTDSKSNTWTLRQNAVQDPGAAGAGVEIAIYTAPMTTAIAVGDTVGITYVSAAVVVKNYTIFEFSAATGYTGGNVGAGAVTATPSITTTGSIANGHYVVGFVGAEGSAGYTGFTADSDTTNGSWSSSVQRIDGSAVGTGAMTSIAQYKRVTATATQSYDVAVSSTDAVAGYVDMTAPALGTITKLPAIPAFPSIPSL
jgi:hypothetical protein